MSQQLTLTAAQATWKDVIDELHPSGSVARLVYPGDLLLLLIITRAQKGYLNNLDATRAEQLMTEWQIQALGQTTPFEDMLQELETQALLVFDDADNEVQPLRMKPALWNLLIHFPELTTPTVEYLIESRADPTVRSTIRRLLSQITVSTDNYSEADRLDIERVRIRKKAMPKTRQEYILQERLYEEREGLQDEAELVVAYARYLEAREIDTSVHHYSNGLISDLFLDAQNILIEAKSLPTRDKVRMAIGQLYDYQRYEPSAPKLCLLVGEEPAADLLSLLEQREIACIWQTSDGNFDDTLDGALTHRLSNR